jgi:lipid A 4'-phosphatase
MLRLSPAERAVWAAMIGLSALFVAFPGIDLAISRAVYLGDGSFVLGDNVATRTYGEVRDWASGGFIVLLLAAVVMNLVNLPLPGLTPRKTLSVIISAVLAPGLIANLLLKEHFGRARPRDILEFGGSMQFSPAWIPTDQCAGNCSFVSGDAAFAFIGLALALCCTRGRGLAVAAAIAIGVAVGVFRVLQGAHFASDSIIGGLITVLTVLTVHRILVAQSATTGVAFIAPGGWIDTWPRHVRRVFRSASRSQDSARRCPDN